MIYRPMQPSMSKSYIKESDETKPRTPTHAGCGHSSMIAASGAHLDTVRALVDLVEVALRVGRAVAGKLPAR